MNLITLIQGEVKGRCLCNDARTKLLSPVSIGREETVNRRRGWRREQRREPEGGWARARRTGLAAGGRGTRITLGRQKEGGGTGGRALWVLRVAGWAQSARLSANGARGRGEAGVGTTRIGGCRAGGAAVRG